MHYETNRRHPELAERAQSFGRGLELLLAISLLALPLIVQVLS